LTTAKNQLESAGPDDVVGTDNLTLKTAATGVGIHDKEPALNDDDTSLGNKKKSKKTIACQVKLPAKK
jgi:hypothetical protein